MLQGSLISQENPVMLYGVAMATNTLMRCRLNFADCVNTFWIHNFPLFSEYY